MKKQSRDEISQMVMDGIEIKKLTANQTDNVMKDYLLKQGLSSFTPSKPKTSVDEEAVREFQMNQKLDAKGEPIVIERAPAFDLPPQPTLTEVPNRFELLFRIEDNNKQLRELRAHKTEIETEISDIRQQLNEMDTKTQRAEITQLLEENGSKIQISNRIRAQIKDFESQNRTLQAQIEEIPRIEEMNQATVAEWERTARDLADEYERTHQTVMRVASTDRHPFESEDEYQQRLQANQLSRDEILQEAFQFKYDQFKKDLKEIIRNPAIIELVLNSLTKEELVEYHKMWPKLKADFISIYGVNSSRVSADDIIEAFSNTIQNLEYKRMKPTYDRTSYLRSMTQPKMEHDETANYGVKVERPFQSELSAIAEPINEVPSFFTPPRKKEDDRSRSESFYYNPLEEAYSRMPSLSGARSKSIIQTINNKYSNPTIDEVRHLIQKHPNEEIRSIPLTSFGTKRTKAELLRDVETVIERDPFMLEREADGKISSIGFGLPHPTEKKGKLGKVIIDIHKLYYNNQLSVRDKNNQVIGGFRVVKVSDDFVNLVLSLTQGKTVSKENLKRLQISERQLYDNLLFLSGLHKGNYNSSDKTIRHLKEQEKIIIGEIMAGNDNPQLYSQYKAILHKLNHFGQISSNVVKGRLRDLRNA